MAWRHDDEQGWVQTHPPRPIGQPLEFRAPREFWGDRLLEKLRRDRVLADALRAEKELSEARMRAAGVMDAEGRIRLDG